jgi:hypothetical protein
MSISARLEARPRRARIERIVRTRALRSEEVAHRADQEGPRAARRHVLNLFYEASTPHPVELRARRQAPERRRRELLGQRLERREGRVAQGHRPDAEAPTSPTRSSCARPWAGQAALVRVERRGVVNAATASTSTHPGPARRLHAAPSSGTLEDRRSGSSATSCTRGSPVEHPRLPADGRSA